MGYTHYWSSTNCYCEIPSRALAAVREVVGESYREGLIQREYDDPREPLVTPQEIRFNGVGEGGHETFRFSVLDASLLNYCKTARKPYDEVVMKVLLILGYYLPGLDVTSDGRFDEEWAPTIAWFDAHVGAVYVEERLRYAGCS